MKNAICQEISEQLPDYADGLLAPDQAAKVAKHVEGCLSCQILLAALRRSMTVTTAIWHDAEHQLAHTRVLPRAGRRYQVHALVAAILLLALNAAILWHYYQTKPSIPPGGIMWTIDQAINNAGTAAEMLAGARILAQTPGGQDLARERLEYIVKRYSDTKAAKQAAQELQSLSRGG